MLDITGLNVRSCELHSVAILMIPTMPGPLSKCEPYISWAVSGPSSGTGYPKFQVGFT